MAVRNGLVFGTAMTLCALVAGCGDSGGGSVASAGLVAPPSGVNANLMGTLKSESFANQAAEATLSIVNSSVSGTIGQPAASFIYDATSQSYTMTVGGKSQTFTPAMINSALSSSTETLYVTANGSTDVSLTLTKPGTSGRFTYEYVGAAFWENIALASQTNGSGTIYAMAYGEPTAVSAVPTSGQGYYNIDLIGAQSHSNVALPTAFTGTGAMNVNFGTGAIALGGTIDGTNSGFSSNATLAGSGVFSGTINLNLDSAQTGQLTGRFYGPAVQEVGAVFDTTAGGDNIFDATGVIIGRQATGSADTSFGSLTGVDQFTADRVRQPTSGTASFGTAQVMAVPLGPGSTDVTVKGPDYAVTTDVGAGFTATSVSPKTMATVIAQPVGTSGFQLLSEDDSFVRVGVWWDTTSATAKYDDLVFGFITPASQIPLTGYADYAVNLDAIVQRPGSAVYEETGAGRVGIEFATGAITTQGSVQAAAGGANLGNWNGSATLASATGAFSGALTTTGANTWTGSWQGRLYGASASFIGAVFAQTGNDGSTIGGVMTGRYTDNVDPSITLLNLPAATTFTANQVALSIVPSNPAQLQAALISPAPQVSYNPASDTYTLAGPGASGPAGIYPDISATLNSATADAAESTAEFAAYSAPGLTARVLRAGPSNPTVQLSYTSFVEVTQSGGGNGGTQAYQNVSYIPFGIATQAMPATGSASYSGAVYGTAVTANLGATQLNPVAITGTGTLSANFATNAVSSTLNLNAAGSGSLGSYTFTGALSGNTFNASLATTAVTESGLMHGTFNGPAANEVGANWTLSLPGSNTVNGTQIVGAFVGKKN